MSLGKPVSFLEITIPYSANVLLQRLIKVKYVKKKICHGASMIK